MALIAMWKCDRDDQLFDDKKKAEEHDKLLELAANISHWLDAEVQGIPESVIEDIGLTMAKNKELLLKAIKGKPDILLSEQIADNKITKIKAKA